jgi:hypothetical protein
MLLAVVYFPVSGVRPPLLVPSPAATSLLLPSLVTTTCRAGTTLGVTIYFHLKQLPLHMTPRHTEVVHLLPLREHTSRNGI